MLMQLGVVDTFGQLLRFPSFLEVSFRVYPAVQARNASMTAACERMAMSVEVS